MVEFALVLLPLIGVLLGIITGGLAYFSGLQLDTAAQEGARVMYVGGTADQAEQAVVDAAGGDPPLALDAVTVTGTCTPATDPPATITVTAQRPAEILWFFGSTTINLEGRGVTRCQ